MKKFMLSVLIVTILVSFNVGNAFASEKTTIPSAINEVLGTPYKWGGTTTKSFDCSGFIQYIFKQIGVQLPRTTKLQAKEGEKVAKKDLRAGDLVFFNTDGTGISHAGIVLDDGLLGHASASKGVRISELSEDYYMERYVTARRVLSYEQYESLATELY